MPAPLKTFVIYASADRDLHRALERQLKSLVDNGLIRLWSDKEILPGEVWDATIKQQLLEADLFLMLISADFFHSDYIREKEFAAALQKLENGEAIVIPVIGRDCDWEAYPDIQKLQVLPPGGVAVTDLDHWKTPDKAWAEVVRAIRRRIEALHSEQAEREDTALRTEEKRLAEARKAAPEPQVKRNIQISLAIFGLLTLLLIWDTFFRPPEKAEGSTRSFVPYHLLQQQTNPDSAAKTVDKPAGGNTGEATKPVPGEKKEQDSAAIPSARKSGLDMVPVQGGTFTMGSNEYDDEKPPHQVNLSSFSIGKYEVTQADWFAIMGTRPSSFENCDQCPVENVSWNEVQEFLKRLNKKYPGKNYRLPTEAEWEYAARGGAKSNGFAYAGSNDPDEVAWFGPNSGDKTRPVGRKKANELGLYDMSGNVLEWCSDWHGGYPAAAQTNPAGTVRGVSRILRGGYWGYAAPQGCRSASRANVGPGYRDSGIGFRLAL
ncbi:MAG: SUMF1/EgtB/PvdO family nonheme iron enzyme [Saprospiraceae bacterium]|nr:SUMF1/EgtB/PvdO family nonheme iron enzyme [Saprospiraceae bacterium]